MSETFKQFVDTNVLIYAHDVSAGEKHDLAKQLLRTLWEQRTGCLSVQVLQEFYVNVTQKVAKPIAPAVASQIITELSTWETHRPGTSDIIDAIQYQQWYQLSFWDAMIIASAMQLRCRLLWSEDLNPGQVYGDVEVRSPFGQPS